MNATESPRIEILIVDDHPLVREELAAMIASEQDMADDGTLAVTIVLRRGFLDI